MGYEETLQTADKALEDVQKFFVPYLFDERIKDLNILWNKIWEARKALAEVLEKNNG